MRPGGFGKAGTARRRLAIRPRMGMEAAPRTSIAAGLSLAAIVACAVCTACAQKEPIKPSGQMAPSERTTPAVPAVSSEQAAPSNQAVPAGHAAPVGQSVRSERVDPLGGAGGGLMRMGGCQTTPEEYGLPALSDSLGLLAFEELMAPGQGPRTGPASDQLEVDGVLFLQAGAIVRGEKQAWVTLAGHVTRRLREAGIVLASRSALLHTTGTCFPPYHVDFRAVGRSPVIDAFVRSLADQAWDGFAPTPIRSERSHFLTAGRSLQQSDVVIDLIRKDTD
jgi:hypothetical protein